MRYLRIFGLYMQEMTVQRLRNVVWFLIGFINSLILLLYWHGALKGGQTIGGWSYEQIQSYYLLLFVMHVFILTHNDLFIGIHDIKNGFLSTYLLKPISYLFTAICRETPARFIQGGLGLVAISIFILLGFKLKLGFTIEGLPLILMLIVNGYFISFFLKAVFGELAFWFTETRGFSELYDVLLIIFAGLVVPLDLFPAWLKPIAFATPFPYMVYYPTAALAGRLTRSETINAVLIQFAIIAILYTLFTVMWKSGVKKFTGVGQ